jgi:hypothetical protein
MRVRIHRRGRGSRTGGKQPGDRRPRACAIQYCVRPVPFLQARAVRKLSRVKFPGNRGWGHLRLLAYGRRRRRENLERVICKT